MIMQYKVLTLWEPFATLVVHGIKTIETRPKPTTWVKDQEEIYPTSQGVYLIHAAQKWTKQQRELCLTEPFFTELERLGYIHDFINENDRSIHKIPILPKGMIIGSVEVDVCLKIYGSTRYHTGSLLNNNPFNVSDKERKFGDYTPGRYAWILKNPKILKRRIPYKGGQGYYQNFKGYVNQLIFK